ncbi:DNA-3-methyladenine glycosylase [Capsicum annuum]|uniref:DNA-3-methyladenine glycosylase n=1 Tax=Capsicum annuum TaxID=4072 RepID=UPI001FB0B355|nr:DNA-3-methyladenine glycosylase [Capsicum annuum]
MSKPNVRRYNEIEKHKREKEPISNNYKSNLFYLSKHLKKVYPIELTHKTYSLPSSLSRLSSSLSHTLNDSSPLDQKKSEVSASNMVVLQVNPSPSEKELMRCSWLTSSSDKAYVKFHDECWGVPVYDDHRLFELLSLAGLLMDSNWTEILKRREQIREGFVGFNAKQVAKMGEKEINELVSNVSLMLPENRVRSIVDNAKCIIKIGKEFGSFSCYMWNHMNYKPIINKFRNARNVPLRSPKAESISKDLVKRGFRHVGPVIVNSFMQAAGMTIDHLIYCFRHKECVDLAETPWRHF